MTTLGDATDRQKIVTLTLNPALDVSVDVDVVVPTHKLRTSRPRYEPGGGGINVSRVCHRLGQPTVAVVPLGGPSGQRMTELLNNELIESDTHIAPIAGDTRESIAVNSTSSGDQYRFVLPGPELGQDEIDACLKAVVAAAGDPAQCRCVVISGSVPPGVDESFIGRLVGELSHASVVVDTSRSALQAALSSGAYIVKPSARELAAIVDRPLITEGDIMEAALEVQEWASVEVLVVSIGPGGAVVVTDNTIRRVRAPTVQVRSAVGAGDSMVAGIAVGIQRGLDLIESVALGVAAGTAAVLTDGTDLCQQDDVGRLLPLVDRPGYEIEIPRRAGDG